MDQVLVALAIFGFGYCFAMLVGLLKPRITSVLWSWRVRKDGERHSRGPWKMWSAEEKTEAKRVECFQFANMVQESNRAAIYWFKLGAIYWKRYEEMWLAKLYRSEFITWNQAYHIYDRVGWNNILEMNRWQIANSFKEMASMIEQNEKDASLIIRPALASLEQIKKLKGKDENKSHGLS